MKVEIKANTINQIVNADVIGPGEIATLSPNDKDQLIVSLVESMIRNTEQLQQRPAGVSSEQAQALAEKMNALLTTLSSLDAHDITARKSHITQIFDTFKTYFGGGTEILLNAVKLAQVVGLFGVGQ